MMNLGKRVFATLLSVVIAVSTVNPAYASGTVNEYGFKTLDASSDLAKTLLYGADTAEYSLGIASHFVIFTKEVSIGGGADCEGRIASDEFLLPTGFQDGYPVKGNLTSAANTNQTANDGSAAVICNNSLSGEFGYVQPHYSSIDHPFVVSTDVHSVVGPVANEVLAQTYATEPNALINFDREFQKLNDISRKLSTKENGTSSFDANQRKLTLTGTDAKVNFFSLTAEDFEKAQSLVINVPDGSFVVINVSGTIVDYTPAFSDQLWYNNRQFTQNSTENAYLLYNFYEATKVNLNKPSRGAILAPKAYVEDKVPANQGHHSAQIVARQLYLRNQIDFRGFLMPKSYIADLFETPVEGEDYTVHYLYYDAEGNLKELPGGPDGFYKIFIGADKAPEYKENYGPADPKPYQAGTTIQAIGSAEERAEAISRLAEDRPSPDAATLKLYADLYANQCEIRFAVYEDGLTSKDALKGGPAGGLTDLSQYESFQRKADISWEEAYTFSTSNVYFIMYPAAKVTVDVKWDDKQDKAGKRPDSFSVKLTENVYNPTTDDIRGKNRDNAELLDSEKNVTVEHDAALDKDITFDGYTDCYTYYVPLFGPQADINGDAGTGRSYGSTIDSFGGSDALFNISYTVPEGYKDVTDVKVDKPADGAVTDQNGNVIVDANGVTAQYHIVLRGEYKATFYIVDQNGNRTEVTKTDFSDPYRGLSETDVLPTLTDDEVRTILGSSAALEDYTIVWKDISKNGRSYVPDEDSYQFDYEDVVFETTLRPNDVLERGLPWLYEHILLYRNSHYIPAPMVYERLRIDENAQDYTFVQRKFQYYQTHYAWDTELTTGEYKDERFFLFSFAYGIDTARAVSTRVTVSTKGIGRSVTDFIYDSGNTDRIVEAFSEMPGRENAEFHTVKELLPRDPFVDDYDGMNFFRLVLPSDVYENETLYFTVYYTDAFGRESVWFYYTLNLKENNHWTLKGK